MILRNRMYVSVHVLRTMDSDALERRFCTAVAQRHFSAAPPYPNQPPECSSSEMKPALGNIHSKMTSSPLLLNFKELLGSNMKSSCDKVFF